MNDIPVRYNFNGDRQEGEALRGHAKRVMFILENIMTTGGLQQHLLKFQPYPGALIIAHKFFGHRTIDIFTGGTTPVEYEEHKICICECALSIGWVLELQPELLDGLQLYTVMACNAYGTMYVPYYDVLPSDFTKYIVGQKALLIPYNANEFTCCADKTGALGSTGCKPILTEEAKSSDDWRTAYRVTPLNAFRVPLEVWPFEWNPNN